jgi:hypothetical protein
VEARRERVVVVLAAQLAVPAVPLQEVAERVEAAEKHRMLAET